MKYLQHLAKKFISIICILALLMTIVTVPSFADDSTTIMTEYELMLDRLSSLETLATNYYNGVTKANSVDFLVLSYIRSASYNSTEWTLLAGKPDENFKTYVENHNSEKDITKLRATTYLVLPNGDRTDFIHMFAEMNMAFKGSADLGGWMGDTYQMMQTLESNKSIDPKTIFRKGGNFGKEDWIADIDGFNLFSSKQKNETWAECLARYYTNVLSEKARISLFLNYKGWTSVDKNSYRSKTEILFNSSTSAMRVVDYGLFGSPDSTCVSNACNCVADYLYLVMTSPELRPGELAIQDNAVYFLDNATKYNYLAASYSEEQMIETAQGVLDYDIWKCEFSDAEFDKINVFMLDDNYIPKAEEMTIEKAAQ